MRILAFNDIHRDLAAAAEIVSKARDADLLLGAGDFSARHAGLIETIEALRPITTRTILIAGNNETPDELRAAVRDWPAAEVLHGASAAAEKSAIFGIGGGLTTGWDWSFDLSEAEFAELGRAYPRGADPARTILLLHQPPLDALDGAAPPMKGSRALRELVERHHPALVFCGHIHECWGGEHAIGRSRVINAGPRGRFLELEENRRAE